MTGSDRLGPRGRQLVDRVDASVRFRARRHFVRSARHWLPRRLDEPPVVVFGFVRSGTTWLLESLARSPGAVPLFEPLRPGLPGVDAAVTDELRVPGRIDPEDDHPALAAVLDAALAGEITTKWTAVAAGSGQMLRARRAVVKLVRLNHGLAWFARQRPDVPIVVVFRHPEAVLQSMARMPRAEWFDWTPERTRSMLSGRFGPEVDELLAGELSRTAIWAAWWCAHVRDLLEDAEVSGATVVFHEDLRRDHALIEELWTATGLPAPDADVDLGRRSVMDRSSSPEPTPADGVPVPDELWRVVGAFGVDLYDRSTDPVIGPWSARRLAGVRVVGR